MQSPIVFSVGHPRPNWYGNEAVTMQRRLLAYILIIALEESEK